MAVPSPIRALRSLARDLSSLSRSLSSSTGRSSGRALAALANDGFDGYSNAGSFIVRQVSASASRHFHGSSAFLARGLKVSEDSFFSARSVIGNRATRGNAGPLVETRLGQSMFRSLRQIPASELGCTLAIARRQVFTDGWAKNWTSSKEKLKQTLVVRPKDAITKSVKDSAITDRARTILSNAKKPLEAIHNTASHYKEAVGLQVEAFWKRNHLLIMGALGVGVCFLLWRTMFGIASMFVELSEGMAKFGFLALAAAIVAFAGLILRARFTINPNKVYRIAMRKLNTSAAALENLGPPLSGTDVRAYVMHGGGLRFKNFKPRFSRKRCFLIFPVRGSERRGLVSVEVRKKKGQYDFKLLSVDVAAPGTEQRIYLIGDEVEYKVGGGLISELRDPILKAMAAQKQFDDEDEKEDVDDERVGDERAVKAKGNGGLQQHEMN
eukprot:c34522_g1_i1 orf=114-1433(+)